MTMEFGVSWSCPPPVDIAPPATPRDTAVLLRLNGVGCTFPGVGWALQECSLGVRHGELLSVVGPSGSGKTTLLRLIAGFERPTCGEIRLAGRVISHPNWIQPPERRRIGMLFQDGALFPHLTIEQNVRFGLRRADREPFWRSWRQHSLGRLGLGNGRADDSLAAGSAGSANGNGRVHKLLALTGLEALKQRYPHELSGGQQQRAALARALAPNPRLLLLDEPFSSLDSAMRQHLRTEVKALLSSMGATAILVTHDCEEATNLGDRVVVLNQGRIVQVDPPHVLLNRPRSPFVARFFGLEGFLPARLCEGRLETELGSFAPPPTLSKTGNGRYALLIHPGQVRLCVDHFRDAHSVKAHVEEAGYQAGLPRYLLRLPSGLRLPALLPHAPVLRIGESVLICLDPHPLVVYPQPPQRFL